jgi:hypothetical protein
VWSITKSSLLISRNISVLVNKIVCKIPLYWCQASCDPLAPKIHDLANIYLSSIVMLLAIDIFVMYICLHIIVFCSRKLRTLNLSAGTISQVLARRCSQASYSRNTCKGISNPPYAATGCPSPSAFPAHFKQNFMHSSNTSNFQGVAPTLSHSTIRCQVLEVGTPASCSVRVSEGPRKLIKW